MSERSLKIKFFLCKNTRKNNDDDRDATLHHAEAAITKTTSCGIFSEASAELADWLLARCITQLPFVSRIALRENANSMEGIT